MLRRIDLPDFVETRWMHCRLGRTPDTASRLTVELPFHLPPQRRPTPGPGIVPIVTTRAHRHRRRRTPTHTIRRTYRTGLHRRRNRRRSRRGGTTGKLQ